MLEISDSRFEELVNEGIDAIDDKFLKNLKNVAIVIEDMPNQYQLQKGRVQYGWLLFGLYEGIPLPARNNAYSGVVPDKITIFKYPLLAVSRDEDELRKRVKNTVWHEIAHYFGLGHDRIHELERIAREKKREKET